MATWTLIIDNRLNTSTTVYPMEHDPSGQIITPNSLWILIIEVGRENNALAKRLYNNLMFQNDEFPPICKAVAPRTNTEKLYVSEGTTALQMWTYSKGIWTAQPNITDGIADRAIIQIPPFKLVEIEKK